MNTRRTGVSRNVPGPLVKKLNQRGLGLSDVAAAADCTYRYVQYVLSGKRLALRGKKAQKVLHVVRGMLARKPTALSLKSLAPRSRRRAA